MISDKVRPHHLERKAILYVRQSSAHQVLHNRESSALQYGMRDRLTALGWSEIEVIDDDLGRSAAGGVQRAGFERMVAEVCLGKVGAVCAREVSRFARNSRDWQQLIEMCRVVDTVLVDQETIYAPRHGNDRPALKVALRTLPSSPRTNSQFLHRALATASGAAGGTFGLAALPVELPVSTVIMLRSIADIARSEGEDLSDPEAALSCVEVFALGGRAGSADASEIGRASCRERVYGLV